MLTPATALGGALSERLRLAENGEFMTLEADPPTNWSQVLLGLGLYCRVVLPLIHFIPYSLTYSKR